MMLAKTVHRNERNQKLIIEPGSFLWELYNDAWDKIVAIIKSTQCGITEWNIVTSLAMAEFGLAQFTVFPAEPDRNKFLSGKLEKSISYVPYYQDRIKKTETKVTDNKYMKIYAGTNMTYVGSNSESGFTSVTADVATIEEMDTCNQRNISMAEERLSNSEYRIQRWIGNPTHNGRGISAKHKISDKRLWTIPHGCGNKIYPDPFKHLLRKESGIPIDPHWELGREPRLICDKCNRPFDRKSPGYWTPTATGRIRGYHISKLFSTQVSMAEIVDRYQEGLVDPDAMQRVYNGDFGLTYTVEGTQVTEEILNSNIDPTYRFPNIQREACLIGIDPGSKIHYTIWFQNFEHELWDLVRAGWTHNEDGLHDVIAQYNVRCGAIDAGPELELVRRLKSKYSWLWSVDYSLNDASTQTKEKVHLAERRLSVNRTYEMDFVKSWLTRKSARLPAGIDRHDDGAFYSMLQAPIRKYDVRRNCYVWDEGSNPDHYYHTIVYFHQARKIWLYNRKKMDEPDRITL
ncbi:phage terminase large subunit family protein [Leptospira santarosai]|uniref:terminase gpA endonuclease subunit n=1 Tax=Leptospira santarosai TaxID=28183 RepID=UPI0024AFDC2C|nr:terminase gpA endonuclease subunit [Leptospira santarosai]MDI7218876.1 phage terminase large subunit family protein [Leptospira santarosai]